MISETKEGFYTGARSAVRSSLRSAILAVILAGITFSVLPLFGFLAAKSHKKMHIRPAPDITLHHPPPPPIRPEKKPQRPKERPKLKDKPELRQHQHIEALRMDLDLGMSSLANGVGDFSLSFRVHQDPLGDIGAQGPPVFDLSELDSPPRPLVRSRPIYPFRAREQELEGLVRLVFVVEADGAVSEVRVARADPEGVFDRAAIAAIRRWRFAPGTKGGQPVRSRVSLNLRFNLDEG